MGGVIKLLIAKVVILNFGKVKKFDLRNITYEPNSPIKTDTIGLTCKWIETVKQSSLLCKQNK